MHRRVLHPLLVDVRFVKRPASLLGTIHGLHGLDRTLFLEKSMRQLVHGQVDEEGNDISDYFVVADVGAVVLFDEMVHARRWANQTAQVNIEHAPSLKYIKSSNHNVSLILLHDLIRESGTNISCLLYFLCRVAHSQWQVCMTLLSFSFCTQR